MIFYNVIKTKHNNTVHIVSDMLYMPFVTFNGIYEITAYQPVGGFYLQITVKSLT